MTQNAIFENGILKIIDQNLEVAVLVQPTWFDGTPWADEEEALVWGLQYIEYLNGGAYLPTASRGEVPTLIVPSELPEGVEPPVEVSE